VRRVVASALAVGAGLLAALATLVMPAQVRAAAPAAAAWWNRQNTGLLAPPPPTGVNPGDLFSEGAAGDRQAPVPPPPPFADLGAKGGADAIAALRFDLPPGATVEGLTLRYDGAAPASPNVVACATTAEFKPVDNGPWSEVPPYDCIKTAIGALGDDGKSLVFADIGALARGTRLSFVLVARYFDREVWLRPGADALKIRDPLPSFSFGGTASQEPAAAASTPPAAGAPQGGQASVPGFEGPPVPVFPPTGAVARTAPQVSASVPALARPAGVAGGPAALDSTRSRVAAASFLVISLLVFALLTAADNLFLRRLLGMRLATADVGTGGPAGRGIGRFRRPRSGRPFSV
jgi:hypothetical protein